MRKPSFSSFALLSDFWEDEDVTTSITWGLCGRHPSSDQAAFEAPSANKSPRIEV